MAKDTSRAKKHIRSRVKMQPDYWLEVHMLSH
jgi:hypothetical protein